MSSPISQRAVLISGPWRPDDNRPISFIAALVVTFCLFGWLLLLNFVPSQDDDVDYAVTVVEVSPQKTPPEADEDRPADDDARAGIEAVIQAPAAPLPPAPIAQSQPINPPATFDFNPAPPLTDFPSLDEVPIDIGRGISSFPGENRVGGANGVAGTGGGTGGEAGGSGSGNGLRSDLTARWAPSMKRRPYPAVYPARALADSVAGVAHLKCFAVGRNRVKDCSIVAESPTGYGFGVAARNAQRGYRVIVEDKRGKRVRNEWIIITIQFNTEGEGHWFSNLDP